MQEAIIFLDNIRYEWNEWMQ